MGGWRRVAVHVRTVALIRTRVSSERKLTHAACYFLEFIPCTYATIGEHVGVSRGEG
jgi:hypothetical protein